MTEHFVVYSHGFGVKKDDRGLLSDIATSMPEYRHLLFDYNAVDESANTLTVPPLDKQADILRSRLNPLLEAKDSTIDVICHSQGCIIAALAQPRQIRKIIFLAPPDKLSIHRMLRYFGKKDANTPEPIENLTIARSDGSTTIVPADYWQSIQGLDLQKLYSQLAARTSVIIFQAMHDEVLGQTSFNQLNKLVKVIQVSSNHSFSGLARPEIIKLIAKEL